MALADNWEAFIRIHGGESGARDMFERLMDELLRVENPEKEVHLVKAAQGDGGIDALREIGEPSRICFMIGENGHMLLMVPYNKRDFRSHNVSKDVYDGSDSLEISSMKLCRIIAFIHNWDMRKSYRVPGKIFPEEQVVLFNLDGASIIKTLRKSKSKKFEPRLDTEIES